MSSAFKDLDEENLKLMEASLMENIDKVSVTSEHIQERFNKLIYGINTIIKCGTWQPVKFQLVSRSWNEMVFFITSPN